MRFNVIEESARRNWPRFASKFVYNNSGHLDTRRMYKTGHIVIDAFSFLWLRLVRVVRRRRRNGLFFSAGLVFRVYWWFRRFQFNFILQFNSLGQSLDPPLLLVNTASHKPLYYPLASQLFSLQS